MLQNDPLKKKYVTLSKDNIIQHIEELGKLLDKLKQEEVWIIIREDNPFYDLIVKKNTQLPLTKAE